MPRLFLYIFLMLSTMSPSLAQEKSISPVAFGTLPEVASVQLSPDGDKILLLENRGGKIVLVTRMLDNESGVENIIPYDQGNYSWATWASNDRILASVRYVGHEARAYDLRLKSQRRLLSMHWDGTDKFNPHKFKTIGPSNLRFSARQPQVQDQIIDMLKDDPDHVLMQMDLAKAGEPAVYKLNIKTRKRTRILKSRRSVDFWMTDKDHVVRYGEGYHEPRRNNKVRHVAVYRKSINDPWLTLFDFDENTEKRPFYFEGYSDDPDIVFITADDKENGKRGLYTYNVDVKEIIEKLAGSPDYDIVDVSIDENYKLEYYSYYREKAVIVRLSDKGRELDKLISELFPNRTVTIGSKSKDEKQYVLYVEAPHAPQSYYYLNIETGDFKKIASTYNKLDHSKLSEMMPITYMARDGLEIPGYLTLPIGSDGKNLPMVIMPHGGPMSRDGWTFDDWAQFLTTRGIAVLQMNYRGSTGYGEKYRMLGDHEWGRKMLYDINDGAKWAVEQGYADPDRMCIMGGSYGGYAALQSVVMGEVPYKCVIANAPITNISSLMNNLEGIAGYTIYKNYVESDDWSFDEASPQHNIDKINVPVLLMHGSKDMSVTIFQSRAFHSEMKRQGKDIKYIEFEEGDHSLSNQSHRIRFFEEVEQFIKKHLN